MLFKNPLIVLKEPTHRWIKRIRNRLPLFPCLSRHLLHVDCSSLCSSIWCRWRRKTQLMKQVFGLILSQQDVLLEGSVVGGTNLGNFKVEIRFGKTRIWSLKIECIYLESNAWLLSLNALSLSTLKTNYMPL